MAFFSLLGAPFLDEKPAARAREQLSIQEINPQQFQIQKFWRGKGIGLPSPNFGRQAGFIQGKKNAITLVFSL
jgi:hypothetical protein